MAATRNKNTLGNYAAERFASEKTHSELMYLHSSRGQAIKTYQPGDGLLQGRVAGRDLAQNDCDIESFLFGIGSSNLETQKTSVIPKINPLKNLNVIKKMPVVMPINLRVETEQRPMYLN